MNKNNDNKLVPRLRFPEFEMDEQWEKDLLGNIAKNITTGKLDANAMTGDGQYRFYTCAKDYYKIDNYAFDTEALLIAGNGAYLGYIHHYIGKFNAYQRTYVLSDFTKNVIYLKYFLQRFLPYRISREKKDGNTPYIVLGTLTEMPIYVPKSPKEQQKIAACLSSLDEVITAESQKLELLKEHKKGLLQNLFPQEGETVPKLRFKEFEDSAEWEVKKLGEIAEFLKGKGISKAEVDNKGKLPCIRYGELYTHYREIINEIKSFTNLPEDELILSQSNDVIIPSSGETKEDIATASCVKLKGVALGGDLNILRSKLNGVFLAYYLSHGLKKVIAKIAQGDAVVHLYSTQLKKLTIKVPIKKEEQEKIADALSSLDDLINAQSQKIEALKLHKKGLLQGLFPDINEIHE